MPIDKIAPIFAIRNETAVQIGKDPLSAGLFSSIRGKIGIRDIQLS